MQFSVKDTFRAMVEYDSGGKNTVIYDDHGNPNIMFVLSRYNMKLLGCPELPEQTHPAFIINGEKEVDEIFIAKYDSVRGDGNVVCSMMGNPMWYGDKHITCQEAAQYVRRKGKGWHPMTSVEYGALALTSWSLKTLPTGNTFNGGSLTKRGEYGKPVTDPEHWYGPIVQTGTGPATWSHDGTFDGVFDLVGNLRLYTPGCINLRGEYMWHGKDGVCCNMVDVDDSPEEMDVKGYIHSGVFRNMVDGSLAKSCTSYGMRSIDDDSREPNESSERFGKYTPKYSESQYFDLRTAKLLDGVTIPWELIAHAVVSPEEETEARCYNRVGGKRLLRRASSVGTDPNSGYQESLFETHFDQCDRHAIYDQVTKVQVANVRCVYIP